MHDTGVQFPPIRSSYRQSSQRTFAMRYAPQARNRIGATASQTEAFLPAWTSWALTGTSPEWPQPPLGPEPAAAETVP